MKSTSPPTIEQRVSVHAALGEPHRLRICDELTLSDRSPRELGARLDIASNLLAHHLSVLASAGIIEVRRSAGDGRRRYVRLLRDALVSPLNPPVEIHASSILFVCSLNSARSQLAAALWRAGSTIPASSAGTRPAPRVHPGAIAAAERAGLDLGGALPRAVSALDEEPELIITVCDEANEELPRGGAAARLHWSVADPVRARSPHAFEDALVALRERIEPLHRLIAPETAA